MLADTARTHHWTLVPELSTKAGGKRVVPDGTMRGSEQLAVRLFRDEGQ